MAEIITENYLVYIGDELYDIYETIFEIRY